MKVFPVAAAAAAMSYHAVIFAQTAQPSLAEDAQVFGMRENVAAVDLSPNGQHLVYIAPAPNGGTVAFSVDLQAGSLKPFLKGGSATDRLNWCAFVTDDRLICNFSSVVGEAGLLVGYSRRIAVDRDGSNIKELGQSRSFYDAEIRQSDGQIIDWFPGQEGTILMARDYVPEAGRIGSRLVRSKDGYGVDRIDIRTLKATPIEPPKPFASQYMTDGQGSVRLMSINETTGEKLTGRTKYLYRVRGSKEWRALTDSVDGDDFTALAIDAATDTLFALKPAGGRQALFRIKLSEQPSTELVASHPRVDIDDVVRSANGQKVIGYSFVEDKRETVYFDPEYKALGASLAKAIPQLPLIRFAGANREGSKVLVHAGADNDSGRYFVFDKSAKTLVEVMLVRPDLEKRTLASVKPVKVTASDGTVIPAYLTLPVGKTPKNLPAVVLPHGGPSSRDEWGFDWLAQFLAARGYAVLQPNYRGSSGFGDAWLVQNGFKSWRTSIGDITASARWLASEGIADPQRLAIVGWSYGGYAALQAAVVEPQLFKAVAAIAPVTDLAMLKREAEAYTNSQLVADFVGTGPHVREGSPLQNASAIKVPVLLVHGDMDQNVGVEESAKMESALRAAGTPVDFLRFAKLDHQLDDSKARQEMLVKVGELLQRTIGQ